MAEDTTSQGLTYSPNSNAGPRTLAQINSEATGNAIFEPAADDIITYNLSEDPNAPKVKFLKTQSAEEIETYLQSEELSRSMFDRGYLWMPEQAAKGRLPAVKIKAETMEEDGVLERSWDQGVFTLKKALPSIMNTYADVVGNKELQAKSLRVLELYNLQEQAQQFKTNEQGEVEQYIPLTWDDVSGSEEKLTDFLQYATQVVGQMAAPMIPIALASIAAPVFGAGVLGTAAVGVSTAALTHGIPDVRQRQLEVTNDPDAGATVSLGTVYAGVEYALGPARFLGNALVKTFGRRTAEEMLKKPVSSYLKGAGKIVAGAATGAVRESIAEGAQEVIAGSGGAYEKSVISGSLPKELRAYLSDPQTHKEIKESMIAGAIGGKVFGAATGAIDATNMSRKIEDLNFSDTTKELLLDMDLADPDVRDYYDENGVPKKVVLNSLEAIDADGNIIPDVTPIYEVVGTKMYDGEKYIFLINKDGTAPGAPAQLVKVTDKNAEISDYTPPVKETAPEIKPKKVSELAVGQVIINKDGDRELIVDIVEESIVSMSGPSTGTQKTVLMQNLDRPENTTVQPYNNLKDSLDSGELLIREGRDADSKDIADIKEQEKARLSEAAKELILNAQAQNAAVDSELNEASKEGVLYNKNKVNAARKRLNERGYKDSKKLKDDDLILIDEDGLNEINVEERAALTALGYFKGSNGVAFIDKAERNITKQPKQSKTDGRILIEKLIKDKIVYTPMESTISNVIGTKVTKPLTFTELQQAGYSLGYIADYSAKAHKKDVEQLSQELAENTDPNQREQIKNRLRSLQAAYKLKDTDAKTRLTKLQELVTGVGVNTIRDLGIDRLSQLPSFIAGVQNRIKTVQNSTFLSPQEKETELQELNKIAERALQYDAEAKQLLISLGVENLNNLQELKTMGNPILSKIVKDIKGSVKNITQKEIIKYWSVANGNPMLRQKFIKDIPLIKTELSLEMQRLGMSDVELDVVEQFVSNGTELNGGFLVNYNTIDAATRLRMIGIKVRGGMTLDAAMQDTPPYTIQNKITISNQGANPITLPIGTDPRMYTLHHEAMHYFMVNNFFTQKEKKILLKVAKDQWVKDKTFNIRGRYKGLTEQKQLEEAISEAFASHMAGQYNSRGVVHAAFEKLRKYLNAISNALFNTGYSTPYQIFEAVDLGIIQKRNLQQRNVVLEKTINQNISSVMYRSSMTSIDKFKRWFGDSVIKGGHATNLNSIGSPLQNNSINIQLFNPEFRNKFNELVAQYKAAGLEEVSEVLNETYEILNSLTGRGDKTGLPSGLDVINMNNSIARIEDLLLNTNETELLSQEDTSGYMSIRRQTLRELAKLDKLVMSTQQRNSINLLKHLLQKPNNTFDSTNQTLINNLKLNAVTSEMVEDSKAPKVVFHGSYKKFTEFNSSKGEFFNHVGSEEQARVRLDATGQSRKTTGEQTLIIYPLFLRLESPLRIPDLVEFTAEKVLQTLTKTPYNKTTGVELSLEPSIVKMPSPLIQGENLVVLNNITEKIFTLEESGKLQKELDDLKKSNEGADLKNLSNEVVANAIKSKGYDGLVYRNDNEIETNDINVEDSYIFFDPVQVKHVDNAGEYNLANPNFYSSVKYTEEASDHDMQKHKDTNKQDTAKDVKTVEQLIKDSETNVDEQQLTELLTTDLYAKKMGKFNRFMSHIRIWAMKFPIVAPLMHSMDAKTEYSNTLAWNFKMKLEEVFIPAMRDPVVAESLEKAFEISKDTPGRYRIDEATGTITFVAKQDGKGAGSKLKRGEVVVLSGNAALAYEHVQEAFGNLNAENMRSLLANEKNASLIKRAITILKNLRPDLASNRIFNMTEEQYQNLTRDDLQFIITELKNPSTILQPARLADGTPSMSLKLAKRINQILGTTDLPKLNADGVNMGTGLNTLLGEFNRYERFKQTDYIPLQRYGKFFIALKDDEGNLLEYRMFNQGKIFNTFLNEETEVRKELQERYPNIDVSKVATTKVSISNLRKQVGGDLITLDNVAQFLSDDANQAYTEIRKELDTLINKGIGEDVKGYNLFLKARKEADGVPGYSVDFTRAISQYGTMSAQFAGKNRFNSTIQRHYAHILNNSNDERLNEGIEKWFKYAEDPFQELAAIRRAGFWWFLGGNASSALIQTITLITHTGPFLSGFTSSSSVSKELVKAGNEVTKMFIFNNRKQQQTFIDFLRAPKDEGSFMYDDYQKDVGSGIINASSALKEAGIASGQATNKRRGQIRNAIKTVENTFIGGMFNTMEVYSRSVAYIAAYRLALKDPKFIENFNDFHQDNGEWMESVRRNGGKVTPRLIARMMLRENFGAYGKGNRPAYATGVGSAIFLFSTYVTQALSWFYRMATHGGGNRKLVGQRIFAKSMLGVVAAGGIFATPFADDVVWLYDWVLSHLTGVRHDTKQVMREWANEYGVGKGMIEAFEYGLVNQALDIDLSSRVKFTSPHMQYAKALLTVAGVPTGVRVDALGGAPGAMTFGALRGALSDIKNAGGLNSEVAWNILAKRAAPTFFKNLVTGADYLKGGPAFSGNGTLLVDDTTFYEGLVKSLGFNPTRIKKGQEILRLERLNGGRTMQIRARFNNRIKVQIRNQILAIRNRDSEELRRAQEELAEIRVDLFKTYQSIEPNLRWMIDFDRLYDSVLQQLNSTYRTALKGGAVYQQGQIDRDVLGVDPTR
tara:strand:+ start:406 stop:8436 length:8031 start_codon:yes stop_codon:yes gene_type:complete